MWLQSLLACPACYPQVIRAPKVHSVAQHKILNLKHCDFPPSNSVQFLELGSAGDSVVVPYVWVGFCRHWKIGGGRLLSFLPGHIQSQALLQPGHPRSESLHCGWVMLRVPDFPLGFL